jgi:leader peptidase (prepilin peptidase)/N-methyltransferase
MLLYVWLVPLFVLGAVAGSFLNVCICRLPYEKSILWPSSRCGLCLQPIRWFDNLPLISYWVLRGRCRSCGTRFSIRYFVIEFLTASAFAGLFYLEIICNVLNLEVLREYQWQLDWGIVPWPGWMVWAFHATLLCFLIVASLTDIDHLEIPMPITVVGTAIGLMGGALGWMWLPAVAVPPPPPVLPGFLTFKTGIYAWPLWHPLPAWLPPRSCLTGLATGLAGMLVGMLLVRSINFLFMKGRGREGIGMGDADLMMMVGSFIGWQPAVVACFVAVFPGLVFGIIQLVLRGDKPFPFGPSLAAGSVLTWLGWQEIIRRFPALPLVFFDPVYLLVLGGGGAVFMFVASLVIRILRGPPA